MKIAKVIITASLVAISLVSFSQKGGRRIYNWSLGGRMEVVSASTDLGATSLPTPLVGPAFKFLVDPQKAIEFAALSDFRSGGQIHGIFTFFNPFPEIPQTFRYYVGMGFHAGSWKKIYTKEAFQLGADAQVGVELIPRDIPMAISLDWHPCMNFVTSSTTKLWIVNIGLTLKYYYKN